MSPDCQCVIIILNNCPSSQVLFSLSLWGLIDLIDKDRFETSRRALRRITRRWLGTLFLTSSDLLHTLLNYQATSRKRREGGGRIKRGKGEHPSVESPHSPGSFNTICFHLVNHVDTFPNLLQKT